MKKASAIFLTVILLISIVSGCTQQPDGTTTPVSTEPILTATPVPTPTPTSAPASPYALYVSEPPVLGTNDILWENTYSINANQVVRAGTAAVPATGIAKVLWDDNYLYVRVEVTDAEVYSASVTGNHHMYDGVEAFVSENNFRGNYGNRASDGAQYRINASGAVSSRARYDNWPGTDNTYADISGSGYVTEFRISWKNSDVIKQNGLAMGFDIQINDSPPNDNSWGLTTWNDPNANGFNSSVDWGTIMLWDPSVSDTPPTPPPAPVTSAPVVQSAYTLPPVPGSDAVWVGTWASAQYHGDKSGDQGKSSALNVSKTLKDATLRQIIRTSSGGYQLRLTFSNEFGTTPMNIQAVHIAKATVPASSDTDVSTDTPVTFNGGSTGVIIPIGEKAISDPVDFTTVALQRIAVSTYFGDIPETVTCHVAARANSFVQSGNVASAETLDGSSNTHWFALCNVDILSSPNCQSIVALGDSITDGYGVTNEQYTRWTDILMNKLQENPASKHLSVINMGIGTNKLLNQENPAAVIDRYKRDVLEQPGVGYLVFLIGANDFNGSASSDSMIKAYDEIIKSALAQGIKVYGGTLPPNGYEDGRRPIINDWLRQQYRDGKMYGLVDFDELLKDPNDPVHMLPEYDNDGLHPSADGYAAMGEYVYSLIAADIEA